MVQGVVVQITDRRADADPAAAAVTIGKRTADRGAGVVVVLDLRLGQRGLLDRATTSPGAGRDTARRSAGTCRSRRRSPPRRRNPSWRSGAPSRRARRGAGTPRACTPIHCCGIGAAFGAELQHRHRILVAAGLAVFLLDLPLDRQAVAVPAGDVVGVVAGHLARAVDHVLQDLVQRVADMQVAVGVGRPVMQDEVLPPARLRRAAAPTAPCAASAPASPAPASAGRRASGKGSPAGRRCRGSRVRRLIGKSRAAAGRVRGSARRCRPAGSERRPGP